MPRINPLRKNGHAKPAASSEPTPPHQTVQPATTLNDDCDDIVPPLPLWKQRTTVRPRFNLP